MNARKILFGLSLVLIANFAVSCSADSITEQDSMYETEQAGVRGEQEQRIDKYYIGYIQMD